MESVKRGYVPSDITEFGPKAEGRLRAAGTELCYLLNRGYPVKAASTFVGNHHLLSERQRLALARITSTDLAIEARRRTMLQNAPPELVLDGFNTIVTLEVALSGSLLIEGMDGTIRDMAGLRGTYRIVDKTIRAVELLMRNMKMLGVHRALFYLDKQVSNSGRLRSLLLEQAEGTGIDVQVELHPSVDKQLFVLDNVVSSDAIVLDNCKSWYNLVREILDREDLLKNVYKIWR